MHEHTHFGANREHELGKCLAIVDTKSFASSVQRSYAKTPEAILVLDFVLKNPKAKRLHILEKLLY